MAELSGVDLAALAVAAVLVGFAKTAVGGVGLISVALFAAVLPSRESTGALLPLLLVGDVLAVLVYRRHADWPALVRLVPSVAVGVVAGAAFMTQVDDLWMRRTIGAVVLVLVGVHLAQARSRRDAVDGAVVRTLPAPLFGALAGFTTMVANAGGPVMALYLLAARLNRLSFLGTTAWFFLVVNASKVPFSAGLGLISGQSLLLDVVLAPAVVLGALIGRAVIGRLQQSRFEQVVLLTTVLAGANLLR